MKPNTPDPKNPGTNPPGPQSIAGLLALISTKGKTKQQIKDELYEAAKKAGLIKEE